MTKDDREFMVKKIVLLGSGHMATALGLRLFSKGHQIQQVFSLSLSNANILSEKLQANATSKIQEIYKEADLYLLCIKDDAIAGFSKMLTKILSPENIICHTSGVNKPELIHEYFVNRSLFYPLQSFNKNTTPEWDQIPVFIEGNSTTVPILKELASSISPRVLIMTDKIRTHLHLASVFANNFTNYNLVIAKRILDKADVPFDVIQGLMTETINKAFNLDPFLSQTGPAKRGDSSTIEKHIRLLVAEYPEYRSLYKKYSQIIRQDYKHENSRSNTSSSTIDKRI